MSISELKLKKKKERKKNHILHIRISLYTEFQLNLTMLIFWTKLPEKNISGLKQKK